MKTLNETRDRIALPPDLRRFTENPVFKGPINFFNISACENGLFNTMQISKLGLWIGVNAGLFGVFIKAPGNYYGALSKLAYNSAFFTGQFFVYGATMSVLGTMRQKDDTINHMVAGALAGSLFGVRSQSGLTGVACAVAFGGAAGLLKIITDGSKDSPSKTNTAFWIRLQDNMGSDVPK